jgi:predicted ATPase
VSRIRGDQQFAFRHALIHDVAYQTLPRAARRERHAAVARFLEETTAVGQSHEALAHHWLEAGEASRAVDEFVAAADQAGRGWAKEHAAKLYADALALVPEDNAASRRAITMKRMVTIQALIQISDAEPRRPG